MLQIDNISKSYGSFHVLDAVSLHVRRGSVFGLLGQNGAGKTTLLRIVSHIILPDSGTLLFDGHPLCEADIAHIGYLPEERGLYRKMRVGEQALYLAQLKGLDKATAQQRLHEWFERLGIEGWWNRRVAELSKGMQQKVQFVVTVLHQPKLLVLDEPFSGLDPVGAAQLRQEILRLKEQGTTFLVSTHNMGQAETLCDNIALLHQGRVLLSGSLPTLLDTTPHHSLDRLFIDTISSAQGGTTPLR